jgi:hypothetical protein
MINYYPTTLIHLSLEDFYNDGMTPEQAKQIIEGISDPAATATLGYNFKLKCSPQYINGNWNVETWATTPENIHQIVRMIEWYLTKAMRDTA